MLPRFQVGEYQRIRRFTIKRTEREIILQQFGIDGKVSLHFTIHHHIWVLLMQDIYRLAGFFGDDAFVRSKVGVR